MGQSASQRARGILDVEKSARDQLSIAPQSARRVLKPPDDTSQPPATVVADWAKYTTC